MISRISAIAVTVVLFNCSVPAQTHGEAGVAEERIRLLDPAQPMTYFELAEELGYSSESEEATELARQLALMAWVLRDGEVPEPEWTRSVALLLADLATTRADRQRFLTAAGAAADATPVLSGPEREALNAIASIRRGDWTALRSAASRFNPQAVFKEQDVDPDDIGALAALIERFRDEPAAPQELINQEGDRVVGLPEPPQLEAAEQNSLLRLEAALLRVRAESWAAGIFLTNDAALRQGSLSMFANQSGLSRNRPRLRVTRDGWAWEAESIAESVPAQSTDPNESDLEDRP